MAKKSKPKLHPFEYVGAHKLFTEERFLLADDMGMFKTAQAIFANSKFRQKKKGKLRTLIVTPTSVREHWARELEQWAYPGGDINLVQTKKLSQGIEAAKSADWTIMTYPQMSILGKEAQKMMHNTGFHHTILDECHNAKNPSALRTKAVKTLADQSDYVSLLSGTPIPNTFSDLYVLMSLLDPSTYPFNPSGNDTDLKTSRVARQSFIQLYFDHPQAVKELLHRKMLRRESPDYLKAQTPELNLHRVEIPLTGKHLETYLEVLEYDTNMGRKLTDLEKASLDPWLIDRSLPRRNRGRDVSAKYRFLEEIVEQEMETKNGKVLVFSDLKTDVISPLVERYKDHGAFSITGDTSTDNGVREDLRKRFQEDPDTRVMFATTTMNEGVDLTAATSVVNLTIPWTPSEYHQRYKRSQRPGEVKKDSVDVYFPFTTIPGSQDSLDEATLKMLDSKEEIVSYLLSGQQLTLEELKGYDRRERVPRIVSSITSPGQSIFQYYIKWRGIGSERALHRTKSGSEMSRYIAELYPNFKMAKTSAEVYLPIIERLERRTDLSRKVDLACGPGMLGHFLGEPVVGIDISKDMLDVGKEQDSKRHLIQGKMNEIPLEDRSTDLVLCSLAYQMTEPVRERPEALQEISRILRRRGYSIITMPGNYMTPANVRKFEDVAETYGLTVKDHRQNLGSSKLDIYLLQKTHSSTTDRSYSLKWKGDPKRK